MTVRPSPKGFQGDGVHPCAISGLKTGALQQSDTMSRDTAGELKIAMRTEGQLRL